MRGFPRRNMFRLAQPNMFGCVAALARRFAPKGALPPFIPGPSASAGATHAMHGGLWSTRRAGSRGA
jgi:hypothetical protein